MRSVKIPYKQQGLIHFTCLTFDTQPEETKEKIKTLCDIVGGTHTDALFEVVRRGATGATFSEIAHRYYIDETWLYRLRCKFYEQYE